MKVFAYVLGGALALFVGFIFWRITSVGRGARQRDEKLARELDPLFQRLKAGQSVSAEEVLGFAQKPQFRHMLYVLLRSCNRTDLFPNSFLNEQSTGEAKLAYWMMHPNELQDAPREIELVENVSRTVDGHECSFLVFRYRMGENHWAGKDWLLGLAGPFAKEDTDPLYERRIGAFSRCNDKHGAVPPGELVDWFIGMVRRKSG